MPETITYDQLESGYFTCTKAGNDPPEIFFKYVMADAGGKNRKEKDLAYTPTAGETTTLNAFIAKLINQVKAVEGI